VDQVSRLSSTALVGHGLRPIPLGLAALITCAVVFAACSEKPGPAASRKGAQPDTRPAPVAVEWVDAVVPAGTAMKMVLTAAIGSSASHSGDLFQATLSEPVSVEGREILPAGSVFRGFVGEVKAAGGARKSAGSLSLAVKTVNTPLGAGAALTAEISGVEGGKGGSAGLSLTSGSSARSGAASIEARPGEDVQLDTGSILTIVLSEPMTIKIRK
jgi:hypothetical protein